MNKKMDIFTIHDNKLKRPLKQKFPGKKNFNCITGV